MTLEQDIRLKFSKPDFKMSDLGVPDVCPYCGHALEVNVDSNVHIWCPNLSCSRKLYGLLLKFCDKLSITSLGKVSLQAIADKGLVTCLDDFLHMSFEVFCSSVPRTGEKAYQAYMDSLATLRLSQPKLSTLLAAINIPHCGEGVWEMILSAPCFKHNSDFETLKIILREESTWFESLQDLPRISERVVASSFNNREYILSSVNTLLDFGITFKKVSSEGPLAGKKFCQTGGLTQLDISTGKRITRNGLIKIIEDKGGTWSDTVDKMTYLILDDVNSTSSKAVKARKCGATLLSESDFFALI